MTDEKKTDEKKPEEFNVEAYLNSLRQLSQMRHVHRTFDNYGKYKQGKLRGNHNDLEFLVQDPKTGNLGLGPIISENDDPKMFVNETQAAVEDGVLTYQVRNRPRLETYIKEYSDRIVSDYSLVLNKTIDGLVSESRKDLQEKVEKKEIKPEEVKERMENEVLPGLYQLIGKLLAELSPNPAYLDAKDSDRQLVEAITEVAVLKDLSDEDTKHMIPRIMIEKHGLTDNYVNYRRDWNGIRDRMLDMRSRMIAKKVITKTEAGNYELNKDLIKKAFGGYEGMLDMSPIAMRAYDKKQEK